jgi:DNA ligase (NAD+)
MNDKEILYLKAKDAYYNSGKIIIPDEMFDLIESELIEEGSKVVGMVGYGATNKASKTKLPYRMRSLSKINEKDLSETYSKMISWARNNQIRLLEFTPKYDGIALSVSYSKGRLVSAITRGDGEYGQDITDKARFFVPNTIIIQEDITVIGEVVIPLDTFTEKYSQDYMNPRNFVAGILNSDVKFDTVKDVTSATNTIEMLRDFHFVCFDFNSDSENLNTMDWYELLVNIFPHTSIRHVSDMRYDSWAENVHFKFYQERLHHKTIPYILDGFVMKVAHRDERERLGEIDHHPKWAIAVKFPPSIATTKIVSIEWNVGTTGKLTPVGILEPVLLDGSMISKVSLYNYAKVLEYGTFPDSIITIVKSGDIIPRVLEVLECPSKDYWISNPTELFTRFSDIPFEDVQITDKDIVYYNTEAIGVKKLEKGIKILGLEGIGTSVAEKLYNSGITSIDDLYTIEPDGIRQMLLDSDLFKDGRALDIVMDSISKPRTFHLWQLIDAMQFSGVGTSLSKQLANYYSGSPFDFSGFEKAVVQRMTGTNNEFESEIVILRTTMESRGHTIEVPTVSKTSSDGITFEMTGKPPHIAGLKYKEDYVKYAQQYGYIHTSLNKDTKILVTDDVSSNSTKMKKAKKNGTEIITYRQFFDKLQLVEEIKLYGVDAVEHLI